ncbi:MAG: MTH895/ArsE family thioredoxin-like protein [Oxalobacter sp.]
MLIQIFGPGCARCKAVYDVLAKAKKSRSDSVNIVLEKITDPIAMMQAGVISTPTIAIDGKIVMSGQIPTLKEAFSLLDASSTDFKESGSCTYGQCSCQTS